VSPSEEQIISIGKQCNQYAITYNKIRTLLPKEKDKDISILLQWRRQQNSMEQSSKSPDLVL
jgi:hypothetical protein